MGIENLNIFTDYDYTLTASKYNGKNTDSTFQVI